MYCVWTYHVESPDGEKKWVGQFELYDFIKDGWKVTSSSQELCLAMKEFDKTTGKFLNKERIVDTIVDVDIYLSSATKK